MASCRRMTVKLGGSAITVKTSAYTVREDVLGRASRALARLYSGGVRIAIVHGGGSFGHYEVASLISSKGVLDALDAGRIQLSMLELAIRVARALAGEGVPVSIHPPHSLCGSASIEDCRFDSMLRDYNAGLVPLTYGDAIPVEDTTQILSGDDLAAALAAVTRSHCLVFVSDVPGILGENGSVVSRVASIDDVLRVIGAPKGVDVTGGLERKARTALEVAEEQGILVVMTDIRGLEKISEGARPETVGTVFAPNMVEGRTDE